MLAVPSLMLVRAHSLSVFTRCRGLDRMALDLQGELGRPETLTMWGLPVPERECLSVYLVL